MDFKSSQGSILAAPYCSFCTCTARTSNIECTTVLGWRQGDVGTPLFLSSHNLCSITSVQSTPVIIFKNLWTRLHIGWRRRSLELSSFASHNQNSPPIALAVGPVVKTVGSDPSSPLTRWCDDSAGANHPSKVPGEPASGRYVKNSLLSGNSHCHWGSRSQCEPLSDDISEVLQMKR